MITCLHPVRFYNKYIGSYMSAPCGKCEACLSLKSLQWKQRLDYECYLNKYTYFFTLTYNNEALPRIPVFEEFETYSDMDSDSYKICETYDGYLPVVQKRDVQLFVKRLRKALAEEYAATFRYYIIAEYGSTTKRPHYHGLLWLSSDEAAEHITRLLADSWVFKNKSGVYSTAGRIDCQLVSSSASQYVTTYTSGNSVLPNIYLLTNSQTFHLQSQSPSIGCSIVTKTQVQQIVNNGFIDVDLSERTFGKLAVVPLWKSFESSIYPKCYKFNELSEPCLRVMYELYVRFQFRCVREACNIIASCCQKKAGEFYFGYWDNSSIPLDLVYITDFVFTYFVEHEKFVYRFLYNRFVRAYYLSRHVYNFVHEFGLNYDIWFLSLQHYYSAKELRSLRKQLEFQELCFNELRPWVYPYIVDSCYYDNANRLPVGIKNIYNRQFHITDEVAAIKDTYFYDAAQKLYAKIFNDGIKSKVKNDYLSAHPEFNNLY